MLGDYLVGLGVIGLILLIIFVIIIEIIAIILIAGAIASFFGFSGLLWWIVAIGLFLIINAILGALL